MANNDFEIQPISLEDKHMKGRPVFEFRMRNRLPFDISVTVRENGTVIKRKARVGDSIYYDGIEYEILEIRDNKVIILSLNKICDISCGGR